MKHFYYKRNQRRSAVTLLINIGVVILMWLAAREYLTPEEFGKQAEELIYWINLIAPIVCVLLFLGASWLWYSNKDFEIVLTNSTLKVRDPLFTTYTWELSLDDITQIRHDYEFHSEHTQILIFSKNGDSKQLTQNYFFNRKKLYESIKKVAPHIILPKHANLFKKTTP